jgi:phage gp36-like protein
VAYVSLEEFVGRLPDGVYDRFTPSEVKDALEEASSEADAYLEAIYGTTPLDEIPPALKMHVRRAALYHLLSDKGFSPDGDDQIIVTNYENAKSFYKEVQKRKQALPQSSTSPARQKAVVVSTPIKRGW